MEELIKKWQYWKVSKSRKTKNMESAKRRENLIQHNMISMKNVSKDNGDYILNWKENANQKFKKAKERLNTWLQENGSLLRKN